MKKSVEERRRQIAQGGSIEKEPKTDKPKPLSAEDRRREMQQSGRVSDGKERKSIRSKYKRK